MKIGRYEIEIFDTVIDTTVYRLRKDDKVIFEIESNRFFDLFSTKCGCGKEQICILFHEDCVKNCHYKEINPNFQSVCQFCFNFISGHPEENGFNSFNKEDRERDEIMKKIYQELGWVSE